jgi:hypothetical protein
MNLDLGKVSLQKLKVIGLKNCCISEAKDWNCEDSEAL